MPKLSDLLGEKAKGEITVGGATVSFVYYVIYRERFSDEEWSDVLASTGLDECKKFLPKVLESWDIVDDEGHAIPVTAEAIDQFNMPLSLLDEIERRVIGSDLAGKARNSNNSRAT